MMEDCPYEGDSDMEAVFYDGKLLICGGWNYDVESCYIYDWTDGWSQTEPEKTRRFFDMVVVGNKVLAMGGMGLNEDHTGELIRNSIGVFTFSDGWTTNSDWVLPVGMWRFCAVAIDQQRVVVIGGLESEDGTISGSKPSRKVQLLDTITGTWDELAPMPSTNGLVDHSCTLYERNSNLGIFIVPGDDGNSPSPLTFFYNLESQVVEALPPLVNPRYNHAIVIVEGNPTVIGGYVDGLGYQEIIEEFDGTEWQVRDDVLLERRSGHVAVSVPSDSVRCS